MIGEVVAREVVVRGEVQGVFFRDTCRRQAAGAGVAGWVRNRNDGAVEAWFEGKRHDVQRLVDWCRSGPPGARVEEVEIREVDPSGVSGFRIR